MKACLLALGLLLAVIASACGGGDSDSRLAATGIKETAAPASPASNESALKPLTVHPGSQSLENNRFVALAELTNENTVPVAIDDFSLTLLDSAGNLIARSERTDFRQVPVKFRIGEGGYGEADWCAAPVAPDGDLGLHIRIDGAPAAGITSYELKVIPRETRVNANAFSVSDIVQSAKRVASVTATQIDGRVTNRSGETQGGVVVCCGLYDHGVLDVAITSFFPTDSSGTYGIESLAPGESAPFHCESMGDPNVLQPKFWVASFDLHSQLQKEWDDRHSGQ